jgi:F0F1-type ATP synthase assembly protein I
VVIGLRVARLGKGPTIDAHFPGRQPPEVPLPAAESAIALFFTRAIFRSLRRIVGPWSRSGKEGAALAGDPRGSEPNSGPQDVIRASGQFMGLGLTWALSVLLFLGGGAWLDSRLGTRPILLILGAFVGAGAGFYYLYYHIVIEPRQHRADRDREEQDGGV